MTDTFYRLSGILIAFDPQTLHGDDCYDHHIEAILALSTAAELKSYLTTHAMFTDELFRALKRFLGMPEAIEDIYPSAFGCPIVRSIEASCGEQIL